MRAVVTGGAGLLGSHVCERLVGLCHEVVCVDNLVTGASDNLAHLLGRPTMTLLR
jgi:UDP-glucuronate decarboxylase